MRKKEDYERVAVVNTLKARHVPDVPGTLDVYRGLVAGASIVNKFGRNDAVGTSFVPIALGGVYQTPKSTSATALRIKSGGNSNDTAAGSGARAITLFGTDENFDSVSETLATAGASASSDTSTTFTRLNRIKVVSSGTYATSAAGSHAAAITIENAAGGTTWATVGATGFPKGQSEIGSYTIPRNKTAYIHRKNVSIDSGKTVDLIFFAREGADETAAPYSGMQAKSVLTGLSGGNIGLFSSTDTFLGPFTGPCDVGFMAKVSTGTASVAIEFDVYELDA